ncbi:MAG: replicative DNA helicase [Clostridia bacterium]|nr:replicative DNA helicase [Clostridia bacterium]
MDASAKAGSRIPHSVDAERSVLGSMIISGAAVEVAMELLHEDDFYVAAHQAIFSSMHELYAKGGAVDLVTVTTLLERHGKLEYVGGVDYLAALADYTPSSGNIAHYAKVVQERSTQRRIIEAGTEIARNASEGVMEVPDVLEDAERRIYNVSMRNHENTLVPAKDIVFDTYDLIGSIAGAGGKLTGMATGFMDLDDLTSGLQRSDLIIVAGRPSMGKTAFALNMAAHAAFDNDKNVAIFSLEMSREQLIMRMMCTRAEVSMAKVKQGKSNLDDMLKLSAAATAMYRDTLVIDDSANVSTAEIRSKCRRMKMRQGLDLVIIDYLQLMRTSGKTENRVLEIAEITRSLKILARELDVPIVLLSQLSRAADKTRPTLAHLRESGAIEQDADVVMMLYREGAHNKEADNTAEVILAKHRNGPTDTVYLVWIDEYTKFKNKSLRE